jgi:hypothetical protein
MTIGATCIREEKRLQEHAEELIECRNKETEIEDDPLVGALIIFSARLSKVHFKSIIAEDETNKEKTASNDSEDREVPRILNIQAS